MNSTLLFNTIKEAVLEIETNQIEIHGKGVYFAPEQHIAFCIGQAIMKNRNVIFGEGVNVLWQREKKLGEKGQGKGYGAATDIIFIVDDKKIAIELKLRDTIDYYKADVEKLSKLPEDIEKYFCVLLDSYTENNDIRLINLESEFSGNVNVVGYHSFPTWNNWGNSNLFCNLNLYSVTSKQIEQQ